MFSRAVTTAPRAATSLRVVSRGYAKDIRFGREAREPLLAGVNTLANAVAVTMGPRVRHNTRHPHPRPDQFVN